MSLFGKKNGGNGLEEKLILKKRLLKGERRKRVKTVRLRVKSLENIRCLVFSSGSGCVGGSSIDFIGRQLPGVTLRSHNEPMSWWAIDVGCHIIPTNYSLHWSAWNFNSPKEDIKGEEEAFDDAGISPDHTSFISSCPAPRSWILQGTDDSDAFLELISMASKFSSPSLHDSRWITLHDVSNDDSLLKLGSNSWFINDESRAGVYEDEGSFLESIPEESSSKAEVDPEHGELAHLKISQTNKGQSSAKRRKTKTQKKSCEIRRSFRYFRIIQKGSNHNDGDERFRHVFAVCGFNMETEVDIGRPLIGTLRKQISALRGSCLVSASGLDDETARASQFFASGPGTKKRLQPFSPHTDSRPNSWVGIDFGRRINVRGYSFRFTDEPYPVHWLLEGNVTPGALRLPSPPTPWFPIDRSTLDSLHEDDDICSDLDSVIRAADPHRECIAVRLVQIESSVPLNHRLSVQDFELYGEIVGEDLGESSGCYPFFLCRGCDKSDAFAGLFFLISLIFGILGFAVALIVCGGWNWSGAGTRIVVCSFLGCLFQLILIAFFIDACVLGNPPSPFCEEIFSRLSFDA